MVDIVLRAGKGSPLTNAELDTNFTNLKVAVEASSGAATWAAITGKPTTLLGYGITDAQALLTSGTNIKTVNGQSVLGSGNIQIDGGITSFNTRTGVVTLGSGDVTTALGFTPVNKAGDTMSGNLTINSGAGFVPGPLLHLEGASNNAVLRIESTSVGATVLDGTNAGLELIAGGMNPTSKYAPAIKFGSTDTDFTTTNPKFMAAITAESVLTYGTDQTSGMALAFWTSPTGNTGHGLLERLRINQDGRLSMNGTAGGGVSFHNKFNLTGATSSYGFSMGSTIQSDVTSGAYGYHTNLTTTASEFTLNILSHFEAAASAFGAGSAVNVQYGFRASSTLTGASSNYGFFGSVPAGPTNWNFYGSSAANNYFGGNVGIGSTSLANIGLRMSRPLTGGSVAYGMLLSTDVQPDVVSTAYLFRTVFTTAANAAVPYTIGSVTHVTASQSTLSADSTITNQYGFLADASLIGATNNYGFTGSIPSGTGRWNLYMGGTAQNWIAGNLGIGTGKANPATALDVNGTVTATSFAGSAAALTGLTSGQVTTALGFTPGAGDVTLTGTQTLTNKRINSRVSSVASASSVTPDVASFDQYAYTALAEGLTINAPTGTPVDGSKLVFRILDSGTSRTLSWNATYTPVGVTLPAATTAGKTLYVGCIYNAVNTRWDVIAVGVQS